VRRLLIIPALAIASLSVATPGAATTPPTIEEEETPVEDVGEEIVPGGEDDDDSDNTGLWGLVGLLGLLGLAGLAGRRRVDTVAVTPPPVGPAAPRTAHGATGTADYDR
jgi:hypothetical protein